jgi:hypothetical protein
MDLWHKPNLLAGWLFSFAKKKKVEYHRPTDRPIYTVWLAPFLVIAKQASLRKKRNII